MDSDAFRNQDDEAGVTTWEARFIDSATAAGDALRVVIDGYDNGRGDFGPVVWTPHPGPVYPQAGDVALVSQSDAGKWWVLAWGAAATPLNTAPPAYVTSLPGSPVDGQEVYYAADAANGVIWHLRYRAAAAGSYKWDALGAPALVSEVATAEGTASASYVALATAGPSITVPLAGDYDVHHGATIENTVANNAWMSYDVGGSAASDTGAASNGDLSRVAAAKCRRRTGLAASTALVSKYRTAAGTATFRDRFIRVTPVRVG